MEKQKFIIEHKHLFRDTDINKISDKTIVERIVQYGTIQETKKAFSIIGKDKFKGIFKQLILNEKPNLAPEIINYFILLFKLKNEIPYRDIIAKTKANDFFYRKV